MNTTLLTIADAATHTATAGPGAWLQGFWQLPYVWVALGAGVVITAGLIHFARRISADDES